MTCWNPVSDSIVFIVLGDFLLIMTETEDLSFEMFFGQRRMIMFEQRKELEGSRLDKEITKDVEWHLSCQTVKHMECVEHMLVC